MQSGLNNPLCSGLLSGIILLAFTLMSCETESDREAETDLAGDSWETILEHGSGTLHIKYVPSGGFAYEDDDGHLTGTTIEILNTFVDWAEQTHDVSIDVEYSDESEWQKFYEIVAASGDGVIGTGNVTITEERREEIQFSPPYLNNIAVLMSHEDRPELSSLDEIPDVFAKQTGLMYPGTLHGERMEYIRDNYYPNMPVDTVRSNSEIMDKMAEGDLYFTYVDVYNFAVARDDGVPVKRHEAGDDEDEQFGFIMPLESDWGEPLEEFFEHDGGFLESDTYREIIREHLGENMMEVLLE